MRHKGQSWHTANFIISTYCNPDQTDHGIGFIVTKKLYKTAVARNRIKRKLRPIARDVIPLHARAGDYVIIAKSTCLEAHHEVLKKDMLWALKKLACKDT